MNIGVMRFLTTTVKPHISSSEAISWSFCRVVESMATEQLVLATEEVI